MKLFFGEYIFAHNSHFYYSSTTTHTSPDTLSLSFCESSVSAQLKLTFPITRWSQYYRVSDFQKLRSRSQRAACGLRKVDSQSWLTVKGSRTSPKVHITPNQQIRRFLNCSGLYTTTDSKPTDTPSHQQAKSSQTMMKSLTLSIL